MEATSGTGVRMLGALLFAVVTTLAAVLAHWSGSGMTTSPQVILGGFVLAAWVGWWLLPRRRSRTVVLSSIGVQVVMHVAFATSMAVGGMSSLSMILCQSGHVGGVPVDVPPGYLAPHHAVVGLLVGLQGLPMLVAHVTAGVLSGTWLYAVDRLARQLVVVLDAVVRAVLPTPIPAGPAILERRDRPVRRRERRAAAFLSDWVTGGCGRRGPPVSASC